MKTRQQRWRSQNRKVKEEPKLKKESDHGVNKSDGIKERKEANLLRKAAC